MKQIVKRRVFTLTGAKRVPIETSKSDEVLTINVPQRKRTVRNIVLVPNKLKPKDWGSWKIKSPYATSTVASPILDNNNHAQTSNQNNEDKLSYVPHSPYYKPVHSPQFYGDVNYMIVMGVNYILLDGQLVLSYTYISNPVNY